MKSFSNLGRLSVAEKYLLFELPAKVCKKKTVKFKVLFRDFSLLYKKFKKLV